MAKQKKNQPPDLVRQDGALCATFVNTASGKRRGIETYADLVAWGKRCGVLGAADARRLRRAAAERPADAEVVVRRVLELRACLERIFLARAAGETPAAADLDTLSSALGEALPARRLVAAGGAFRWIWGDRGGDELDRMLWPVLLSAADVLTSKYHCKIRQCAGEGCDLFFVDRTPGSPRKWCSMRTCGHRVKSRRHYHHTVKRERAVAAARRRALRGQRQAQ